MRGWLSLCALVIAFGCGEAAEVAQDSPPTSDTAGNVAQTDGVRTKTVPGFGGVIAKKYEDSQEWWAEETRPPEGAPNVIIFLLDDVGFAQVGSFGGLIDTPNIDALASILS